MKRDEVLRSYANKRIKLSTLIDIAKFNGWTTVIKPNGEVLLE